MYSSTGYKSAYLIMNWLSDLLNKSISFCTVSNLHLEKSKYFETNLNI